MTAVMMILIVIIIMIVRGWSRLSYMTMEVQYVLMKYVLMGCWYSIKANPIAYQSGALWSHQAAPNQNPSRTNGKTTILCGR